MFWAKGPASELGGLPSVASQLALGGLPYWRPSATVLHSEVQEQGASGRNLSHMLSDRYR